MQQRPGNGIFYGYHTYDGRIGFDFREYFFESGTAYQLYLFTLEILMGGYVVERPYVSLYCNSLHKYIFLRKSPASWYMKRDSYVNLFGFYDGLKLKSTRNFPLHNALQSKNKSNRKMRMTYL